MVIKHKTLLSFTLQWKKFLILTGTFSVLDAFQAVTYFLILATNVIILVSL